MSTDMPRSVSARAPPDEEPSLTGRRRRLEQGPTLGVPPLNWRGHALTVERQRAELMPRIHQLELYIAA